MSMTRTPAMIEHVAPEALARFERSLLSCLGNTTFVDRFYARFILANDEIASMFARSNLQRQAKVLQASLYLVLRAASGHADGLAHLGDVGRTHSARGLTIQPHHYDIWLDTLVVVASEVDPRFDVATEAAWRACLAPCIAAVLGGAR